MATTAMAINSTACPLPAAVSSQCEKTGPKQARVVLRSSAVLRSIFTVGTAVKPSPLETTPTQDFAAARQASILPRISCSIATEAKAPITFNIGETSLTLPFSVETAKALDEAIGSLLKTFKEKEKATRPQRWPSMEFRHSGDLASGDIFLECFCNPNAYSNAFQAKVLITVKDDRIRFTSEGPLSGIKADLDQFLSSHQ